MLELKNKKLKKIVSEASEAKGDAVTSRAAMNCLDYTSLKGDETRDDITQFCVKADFNKVASVCIYPPYVSYAKDDLRNSAVRVATVINFPMGSERTLKDGVKATIETTAEDVSKAIASGANQVDIVFPYREFLAGDVQYAQDVLEACSAANIDGVTMKVIIETAAFEKECDLRKACEMAVTCGTNSLKTSTGKHSAGGATLEAASVLFDVARKAGRPIAVKISGGVNTADDCAQYIALAQKLGWTEIKPETFRIGASRVLDDLICKTTGLDGPAASSAPKNEY
jgi:deoxyribose-phosphate aldolase